MIIRDLLGIIILTNHYTVFLFFFRESHSNSNTNSNSANDKYQSTTKSSKKDKKKNILDCGKVVNYTEFDHLRGIADRKTHPHIPEPEVAMIFKKKGSRNSEVDMADLEKRLRKSKKEVSFMLIFFHTSLIYAKTEVEKILSLLISQQIFYGQVKVICIFLFQKPVSAQVYNQIGNFWRIKGNTQLSVECFRKALSIAPQNPDVLLNLARVLFNLQYLDDAIALTRQSLKMQSPEQNSWLQHFTLGEILKAYGHYHEAALHFRHTLDLNPDFQPAEAHLREMEVVPDVTVTYYTLCIILFLVLGVLFGILTSIDTGFEELGENSKTQRHFNRAMAMRSIKLGINPKLIRMRKQMNC